MRTWYLFKDSEAHYVAIDSSLDHINGSGQALFDGQAVPELIAWGMLKESGGFVFGVDGWKEFQADKTMPADPLHAIAA